jgi:hypothetical protein
MEKRIVLVSEVAQAVAKNGYELKDVKNLTSHPADWYLKVVKAYSKSKNEWVVWLYNATDRGLHEGYYTSNREVADIKYDNKK